MIPRTYASEAIILARKNYSEADRIIVVYSKAHGKLSFIAKSVRKTKSRKRGAIEIFSYIRFSAARTKSLDILTEAEIISSFPQIRKNLKKVAVAYYFVEVIGRLTSEGEKNEKLFSLLLKYIHDLRTEVLLKKLRKNFVKEVIVLLGYWPKDKPIKNIDSLLEEITERNINSVRVGKKLLA